MGQQIAIKKKKKRQVELGMIAKKIEGIGGVKERGSTYRSTKPTG